MSIVLIVISIKWWGKWFSLSLKMQICMKNLVFSLVEWIIIANHPNFFTTICSAQLLINVKGPFNWDLRWHSIRRTDLQQRQTFITKIWGLEKICVGTNSHKMTRIESDLSKVKKLPFLNMYKLEIPMN